MTQDRKPTPAEAWSELWEVLIREWKLMEAVRWIDGRLRRFPRFYRWLSR